METIKQDDILVQINGNGIGSDVILKSFSGFEALSSLYEYKLYFTSSSDSIDLDKALKSTISVKIKTEAHERFFHGIIAEIAQGATNHKSGEYRTEYNVKIRPSLWQLTLDRNYKMFQEKTVMDIIKAVLKDCGVKEISDKVKSRGKGKREYCVQYGESSFNFISRLMEEEGIFFFFQHEESKHILVLADSSSAYMDISENANIPFIKGMNEVFPLGLVYEAKMKSSVTTGGSAVADYNYKISQTELYNKLDSQWKGLSFYEYPGGFSTTSVGNDLAKLRVELFEFDHNSMVASSTVPEFIPGGSFSLEQHPTEKFNDTYAIHSVRHELSLMPSGRCIYKNRVRAFSKSVEFRPPRVTSKPRVYGTQSAVVVCPSNEEIYRDKFGCVKVHFHWDRDGEKKDTNDSSCWIRVVQSIAGNGWGSLVIPRVGQEVVVIFENGDPDRPLIIGGVYNDKFLPAYSDKDAMKTSIKTVTFKDNEKGFNEIRFHDEKDKQEFYQHAQKDMLIEIENSRTTSIKESDDILTLDKGNRMIELSAGDDAVKHSLLIKKGDHLTELTEGNCVYTITKGDCTVKMNEGNCKIVLKKGNNEIELSDGDMKITLCKGNASFDIKGNCDVKCSGDISFSAEKNITIEAQKEIKIKAGTKLNAEAGTDMLMKSGTKFTAQSGTDMTLKGGTNLNAEAGTNMSLKASINLQAQANMNLDMKANMKASIASNLQTDIKANAMVNIQGVATVGIKGALVQAGALLKIG